MEQFGNIKNKKVKNKFETEVLPDGIIKLPREYKELEEQHVEVIILKKDSKETGFCGKWQDSKTADEIIKKIYKERENFKITENDRKPS
ncbi:MAG: hypothetical protein ACE5KT_03120 [Methanosarcinales archaeon]